MIPRINHSRSQLQSHLNSYEDGPYSLFVSKDIYPALIDFHLPQIRAKSPQGWKIKPNGAMRYLWFPGLEDEDVTAAKEWCERFSTYVLLGLNPNIESHFSDELDFCMALDFNYNPSSEKRTVFGEAEYQLKFKGSRQHLQVLGHAMLDAIADLPIPEQHRDSYCVTCIPAPPGQMTVARQIATGIAKRLKREFIDAQLNCPKTALKGLPVDKKIPIWKDLYNRGCVELTGSVEGRLIVIIDDLYQSGATM